MTKVERRLFEHLIDRDSGRVFSDIDFRRCRFQGCGVSITRSPAKRSIVRNVALHGCEQRGCSIHAAVFDSVMVDGLKTNGLSQTWAAVFKQVVLRGRIDRVMFSDAVAPGVEGLAPVDEQRAFNEANAAFYESVDWALDVAEAEFDECDLFAEYLGH